MRETGERVRERERRRKTLKERDGNILVPADLYHLGWALSILIVPFEKRESNNIFTDSFAIASCYIFRRSAFDAERRRLSHAFHCPEPRFYWYICKCVAIADRELRIVRGNPSRSWIRHDVKRVDRSHIERLGGHRRSFLLLAKYTASGLC